MKLKYGKLILVPTPLNESAPLEREALERIQNALEKNPERSTIAIEGPKVARRRWIKWGLPREAISEFVIYNEHTKDEAVSELLSELNRGKDVYLMSDGGLPAFCDPGMDLVDTCHRQGIQVTSTPFPHSVTLALALSGYAHTNFWFEGFLPRDKAERAKKLKKLTRVSSTIVLMDTPYRLGKLLKELASDEELAHRELCLCLDLGFEEEWVGRGLAQELYFQHENHKREFVIVMSPKKLN